MIFLVFSAILTVFLIAVTALEQKKPSRLWKWLNLALGACGVLTVLLCRIIGESMISSVFRTETWQSWARDMFAGHYSVSLPVLGVLGGILLISVLISLSEKKKKSVTGAFLRRSVGIPASAVLLLLALLYASVTANESVPLETLVFLSGVGEALILRLVYALEGFFGTDR